jgi:hypothetical protein
MEGTNLADAMAGIATCTNGFEVYADQFTVEYLEQALDSIHGQCSGEEDPCGACGSTCDDEPKTCETLEELVSAGGCAHSCTTDPALKDACVDPYYEQLGCSFWDEPIVVDGVVSG